MARSGRRPRQPAETPPTPEVEQDELDGLKTRQVHKVLSGVSVAWLSRAFGMTRHFVEKRISRLRPIGTGSTGEPLYDFRDAARHLVDPVVDVETYVANLKPEQIPLRWREAYWNAQLKRQKWEANAGQLWHTDAVMSALSDIFAVFRTNVQLVPDTLEQSLGLTPDQRARVVEVIDGVQDEVHRTLLKMAKEKRTPPQLYDDPIVAEDMGSDEE